MILAAAGLLLGLALAWSLTRVMRGLVYGVSTTDPVTFVMISLLFGGVALAASYLPARRASKVDPMVALRSE
jgi:ABC-type antimicrobial peptide transport system permease subunit